MWFDAYRPDLYASFDNAAKITPTVSLDYAQVGYIDGLNRDGTITGSSFWGYRGTTAHKWGGDTAGSSGGIVTYHFDAASNWTAGEQATFRECFWLWQSLVNVTFLETSSTSASALLTRGANGGAFTTVPASAGGGSALGTPNGQATISLQTSVPGFDASGSFTVQGGYGVGTIMHEMGHLIGLGHAGPYNGAVDPSTQQFGPQDDRLWSIMSYIYWNSPNPKYASNYPVTGTNWGTTVDGIYRQNSTTWMPLDVVAAQQLYGASSHSVLTGGQCFGFNCNVNASIRNFFDFTVNTSPVITLYDQGLNNKLDLSGYAAASTVDLRDGHFSSFDGMTNNLAIAYGTKIDAAIGGAGDDTFVVNGDSDTIDGGSGTNSAVLLNIRSAYVLARSGTGVMVTQIATGATDTLHNIQSLGFTDKTVLTSTLASAADDFNGDSKSDLLWRNTNGYLSLWNSNAGSESFIGQGIGAVDPSWQIEGAADFNGDGRADLLWRNANGDVGLWSSNGSGGFTGQDLGVVDLGWKIRGAADFNGDGKADLLWRNANGDVGLWDSNGSGGFAGQDLGVVSYDWQFLGSGDFNGDGKADVLWRNTNGDVSVWNSNGSDGFTGQDLGIIDSGWQVRGIGDFNGDGKADILWRHTDGHVGLWNSNGSGGFAGQDLGVVASSWSIVDPQVHPL